VRILITANSHRHYDRVGTIVGKAEDGRYRVRIPDAAGSILTSVAEGEFKPTKVQDD